LNILRGVIYRRNERKMHYCIDYFAFRIGKDDGIFYTFDGEDYSIASLGSLGL
jgi:hypothetical protein